MPSGANTVHITSMSGPRTIHSGSRGAPTNRRKRKHEDFNSEANAKSTRIASKNLANRPAFASKLQRGDAEGTPQFSLV